MLDMPSYYKCLLNKNFFIWLDDDNIDKWYREAVFTASEKQILITLRVGMLIDNSAVQSNHLRFRLFQKTESLITAVGSDDEKIQPEDLPNNHVQPLTSN